MLKPKLLLYTARTMLDLAVFSALLLGLMLVIVDKGARSFDETSEAPLPAEEVVEEPGETVRLRRREAHPVYVADSHATVELLADAVQHDKTAVRDGLVQLGRVWPVPYGTPATLVRTTFAGAQVRFDDGTHGWVVRDTARAN